MRRNFTRITAATSCFEALVQICGSPEQTPEHVTEPACVDVQHHETHMLAGKMPVLHIWRITVQ